MRPIRTVGVLLAVVLPQGAFAAVTFTRLADTAGSFGSFSRPITNSSGQIAADVSLDGGGKAIYLYSVYSPSSPQLVAQTGATYSGLSTTSLTNAGVLAFVGTSAADSKNRVQTWNGSAISTLYTNGDYGLTSIVGARILNSKGQLAFYSTSGSPYGLYVGTGAKPTLIANSADYLTTLEPFNGKPFNNNGDYVFSVIGNDFNSYVYIAHADGSAPTKRLQGTSSDNRDVASLNDNGTVAIRHGVGTTKWVETIAPSGAVTQVATATGSDSFILISLNNHDQVAFTKRFGSGSSEIDYTDDTGLHRLIGTGDVAFGSTISTVDMGTAAYGDDGRIAFTATLANGQSVLAYATVPEPGSVTIVGGVILAALSRRERRTVRSR
jgi:hypothetical protein